MDYCLVHLIENPAKEFHETLVNLVANRFLLKGALNFPHSHFTLKYTFNGPVEEVESLLKRFCGNLKPSLYQVKGFESFSTDCIYMNIIPADELKQTQINLASELRKLNWMQWHGFDGENIILHASIAHTDLNESNFKDVWNFVHHYSPDFKQRFNNIAIVKLEDYWKIHKIYSF
ncbi:2'-5' RNA ligase family protein [Candidatus Woesearchaeota archaeon]|nr:2'-5' RNA ligase family protein [Candidatus Woesearchaeota archaeon]